jgi:hypothetical protein
MESSEAERKGRIFCPPSVPEALWSKVPADSREDLLLFTARQLRAGFHPRETVKNFLTERGLHQEPVAVAAAALVPRPPPSRVASPPALQAPPPSPAATGRIGGIKLGGRPSSAEVIEDDDDFSFDDEEPAVYSGPSPIRLAKPLHPYGLREAPASAEVPKGAIGTALHSLFGFPGEPGKKAAEAEASVLRAIANDPSYALMEPDQIGNLGCNVPEHFLSSIRDLIVEEAERVQTDILSRRENGDPTAQRWSDPSEWIDNE